MPTVSVIIPAYNAAKTIAETVDSVLQQEFDDFELIIVNDGSTDHTLEILQQCTDPRIRIFTFENAGPQRSRNRGLEKANGTFVSFLDADDLWTADKLKLQIETLQNNPAASVIYSWCDVIDEQGEFLRRGGHFIRRGDVFTDLFLINFGENGSNFLAYLDAIKSVGGFDEKIVAAQDRDMLLSLASQYQFDVVPKVQVFYRKSTTAKSWSSSIERTRAGIEQVINKHSADQPEMAAYKKQGLSNSYKHMLFECLNNHSSRQKGLYALNLLWMIMINDHSFVTKKVFFKVLTRIWIAIALPQKTSQQLIEQFPKIFNITTIYGYLKLDKATIHQDVDHFSRRQFNHNVLEK